MVRKLVVRILAGDIAELAAGMDVMHIQCLAVLLICALAQDTAAITLAGLAALIVPVWAIGRIVQSIRSQFRQAFTKRDTFRGIPVANNRFAHALCDMGRAGYSLSRLAHSSLERITIGCLVERGHAFAVRLIVTAFTHSTGVVISCGLDALGCFAPLLLAFPHSIASAGGALRISIERSFNAFLNFGPMLGRTASRRIAHAPSRFGRLRHAGIERRSAVLSTERTLHECRKALVSVRCKRSTAAGTWRLVSDQTTKGAIPVVDLEALHACHARVVGITSDTVHRNLAF